MKASSYTGTFDSLIDETRLLLLRADYIFINDLKYYLNRSERQIFRVINQLSASGEIHKTQMGKKKYIQLDQTILDRFNIKRDEEIIYHNLLVSSFFAGLRKVNPAIKVFWEKEIEFYREKNTTKFGKGIYPDGFFFNDNDSMLCALEMELTQKKESKIFSKLRAYSESSHPYLRVFYVFRSEGLMKKFLFLVKGLIDGYRKSGDVVKADRLLSLMVFILIENPLSMTSALSDIKGIKAIDWNVYTFEELVMSIQ